MKITSILLLLYLLINFVVHKILFGGCSHCLKASQLIQGAYRLTSFSRHFRAIRKIIIYINRVLFLLSVLRVAWISFINMVYFFFSFLFFTRHVVSMLRFLLTQLLKVLADLAVLTSDWRSLTPFLAMQLQLTILLFT